MQVARKDKNEYTVTVEPEKPLVLTKTNIYDSIRVLLIIAQFFGVMPLHGLGKNDCEVHFKWKSFRVLYAVINVAGAFTCGMFWIAKFCKDGLYVYQTANLSFYICTFLGNVLLIELAKNWYIILKEWSYVEFSMRGYNHITNLKKKFILITTAFLGIGLIEHLFFIMDGVYEAKSCSYLTDNLFEGFFRISFQNFFSLIEYSNWLALLIKFSNTISTFTWIFVDLLITLMSVALTAKYEQIVKRLHGNKIIHDAFLKEIRQDYQKIYHLYQTVNKHFSALILVSYVQNIYFLCIQLYNSLRERTGFIESFYFFYSFGFLVMRLLAVSLYGAWLYDEARKPLEYLHTVPAENYTPEVTLLISQISTTPVGISGLGFFLVTRNFLLQVAGTIVTFELMIFQFAPIKNINNTTECSLTNIY